MNFGIIGKMKYLEELKPGQLFSYKDNRFILTSDFNRSNKRLCISLTNGFANWLLDNTLVELLDLYYRDQEGNLVAVKEYQNEYNKKTEKFS